MLNIIAWLVMGGLVGWVASLIMKTDAQQGIMLNVAAGIVGAALGGFLFRAFGMSGVNINEGFSVVAFLVSLVGAVIVIGAVRLIFGRRPRQHAT